MGQPADSQKSTQLNPLSLTPQSISSIVLVGLN